MQKNDISVIIVSAILRVIEAYSGDEKIAAVGGRRQDYQREKKTSEEKKREEKRKKEIRRVKQRG